MSEPTKDGVAATTRVIPKVFFTCRHVWRVELNHVKRCNLCGCVVSLR